MSRLLTVRRYAATVAVAGSVVLASMVLAPDVAGVRQRPVLYLMLAAALVLGELFPVPVGGPQRPGYQTLSVPFLVALLLSFDSSVAALTLVGAGAAADVRRRQPLLPAVFNAGQYSLALGAAALVAELVAVGPHGSGHGPLLDGRVLLVGLTFVVVNNVLTAGILALLGGDPASAVRSLGRELLVEGSLLLGTPVLMVIADTSPHLLPVLWLPALVVHRSARMAQRSDHAARHDALTGLPNRSSLLRRIGEEHTRARDAGARLAVLVVDVDDFRRINDALGQDTGDRLLQHIGNRLVRSCPAGATVARLDGDAFALVVADLTGPVEAVAVAQDLLGSLRRPFTVDGLSLQVEASLGVSLHPDHGDHPESLLRCANVALSIAKDGHRGVQLYTDDLDVFSRERLVLLGELRGAIDSGQLVAHYQPKIDTIDGSVAGVEALVRWAHPQRGLLSPGVFLPLAEHTTHIDSLTMAMLDQSLRQCREWASMGLDVPVAVNVPPRTLHAPGFVRRVRTQLELHGVRPDRLQLEITESSIMRDEQRAVSALDALRAMGVRIAIDDFGTGYASLSYLRRLPVDIIKIDRAFVRNVHLDAGDQAIVRSTIDLAGQMGKETVAEGVEVPETLAVLRQFGCNHVQGFLFSRPEPADRMTAWLQARTQAVERATGPRPSPILVDMGLVP